MKSIRQLLRQPLKTLTGVLLIAAAVAVLCVGVGQGYASIRTQKNFEEMFTTTAITTINYQYSTERASTGVTSSFNRHLPEDTVAWMEKLVEEHPELVKAVSAPGLASAYIPELIPSNYTQYAWPDSRGGLETLYFSSLIPVSYTEYVLTNRNMEDMVRKTSILSLGASPEGAPYSCAMLEIVLTEHGEIQSSGTEENPYITMEITGTIENVIGLQEGFKDPTGYTARLTMVFADRKAAEAMELVIGDRYLVYGMDYYDTHWELVYEFSYRHNNGIILEDLDPAKWKIFTEENWENYDIPNENAVGVYHFPEKYVWITPYNAQMYRSITLTLCDLSQSYDGTGCQEGLTAEEYRQRYTAPTIAHLNGTAEEFLASEEGKLWRETLGNIEVNNHAFPIAGIQDLSWITAFARNKAELVQGREFSQEELDSGAKVCIISSVLAQDNGLSVGDTISPQFYNYDPHSPYQKFVEDDYNVTQPGAYFYSSHTPIVTTETYTIVGIYEQDVVWQAPFASATGVGEEDQLYTFSPNTIFVPETSVSSDMAYGTQGFFYALILENGAMDDVKILESQAGYSSLLSYYDQGYADMSKGLFDYAAAASLAFKTGAVVYAVIVLLFLLLYPGRETKTLMTMHSLGATRGAEIAHIFIGSFTILLAGTLLGLIGGGVLWSKLTTLIPASKEVTASYGLDPSVLLGVGSLQLLVVCALTVVLALFMSRKRSGLRKDR